MHFFKIISATLYPLQDIYKPDAKAFFFNSTLKGPSTFGCRTQLKRLPAFGVAWKQASGFHF